jgi:hypothetical protein
MSSTKGGVPPIAGEPAAATETQPSVTTDGPERHAGDAGSVTGDRSPPRHPRDRGARLALLAAVVAGLVLVVGTIGPPLFGRGVFLASDSISQAYPWRAVIDPAAENLGHHGYIGDTVDSVYPGRINFYSALRDGDLLAWNPYVIGGYPLGAVGASGVYSPFAMAAYLLLPDWYAPAAIKLITMLAAAGFTYLFCRRLGTDRTPAVLGGLGFAGSGFMVMWTNWSQPEVAALIPAAFWATERFLQRPRPSTAAPIALAVGAMLLGNFPAVVGYALYVLVLYAVVRVATGWGRQPLRRLSARLLGTGAAIATGVLLVAWVLLPFALRLGYVGTDTRVQTSEQRLGVPSLVTAVAPKALGLSTEGPGHEWFGPYNQIEGVSFVGVTLALLAVLSLALPRPAATPRGAREALAGATLVLGWATFAGGHVLGLLQRLPVFQDNFVGRTRSVLGFTVAVLAALGLQAVIDRRWPVRRRQRLWAGGVAVASVLVAGIVFRRSLDLARTAERAEVLRSGLVLPAIVGTAAALAVAVLTVALVRSHRWAAAAALAALPALLVIESLSLALPLLPNEDRATLYPATPGIDFLAANAVGDHVAPENLTLFGNAGQLFGIRTVTGHAFHAPHWKAGLRAADPDAFSRSETFSFLAGTPEVMTSPALDRMGARWFAGSPTTSPPGDREVSTDEVACERTVQLDQRLSASVETGGGLRGVVVHVCEPAALPWEATVSANVGRATGRDHLPTDLPAGPRTIAIPAEDLPPTGSVTVQLSLDGAAGPLALAATPTGEPVLDVVRPADDGLRLVYADDLRIYERTRALPRVRWAGRGEVVADIRERLARLATGDLADDTVVLSEDGPRGSGARATVEITRDTPTNLAATIRAEGSGYLVVSDAIERDWVATVDGERVDLVEADHVGAAVVVSDGTHDVELRYRARGRRAGFALSLVAAAGLAAACAWDIRRGRRSVSRSRTPTTSR